MVMKGNKAKKLQNQNFKSQQAEAKKESLVCDFLPQELNIKWNYSSDQIRKCRIDFGKEIATGRERFWYHTLFPHSVSVSTFGHTHVCTHVYMHTPHTHT